MLPFSSTPLPLIETSCESPEGFFIVIVTWPADALRLLLSYLSSDLSALSASLLPPPPPELVLVVAGDVVAVFSSSPPPQPATTSAESVRKITSGFMQPTLASAG